MSAFANTLGGALIFGMADDGQIVGLTEPDSDAEKISEILKTRGAYPIVRYTVKLFAIRRDFMRCAQPAVRRGHCARRRVSERNRRTAAALSAEIETRALHFYPKKGFFDKLKRANISVRPLFTVYKTFLAFHTAQCNAPHNIF